MYSCVTRFWVDVYVELLNFITFRSPGKVKIHLFMVKSTALTSVFEVLLGIIFHFFCILLCNAAGYKNYVYRLL